MVGLSILKPRVPSARGALAAGAGVLGMRNDPFGNFQFKVDLGLVSDIFAIFSEVQGLEASLKYEDIREGGQNRYVHRLPTRVEYGNLILKRGFTNDNEFYEWCTSSLKGKIDRRLVTVSLVSFNVGPIPIPIYSWMFDDAYPVKWTGPSLRAEDRSMAVETLELAHRGFKLIF